MFLKRDKSWELQEYYPGKFRPQAEVVFVDVDIPDLGELEESFILTSFLIPFWTQILKRTKLALKEREELESEVKKLRSYCYSLSQRINSLESEMTTLRLPTYVQPVSSDIYDMYKEKLEKEHYGKIIAIDNESKNIAGIGHNILEAYKNAHEKTGKKIFSFKRIGYIDKIK